MWKKASKLIKIPIYFLGFAVLGFIFAYFTFKLMSFSRTVDVPDLSGRSLVEATEILNKAGLNLKIEAEDYDSEAPAGYVLRQDVPAGSKVKEQRGIKVILSKGPKAQSVPSVIGETVDKAESILLQRGLRISNVIPVHSNSVEKNRVIAQRPAPDERITEKITLIVSAGKYDAVYYCPDFKGMTQEEAWQLAEKLGLKLRVAGYEGIVKSQKPKPGSRIKAGDTIEIQLGEAYLFE